MIRGNRVKIDLSISNFKDFMDADKLYVDKTRFIKNIMNESNSVLLITRPRRTGKSLNMNMLQTFLDCKEEIENLFDGLYIKSSPAYNEHGKYPVIFLDFKNVRISDYKNQFKKMLISCAESYLTVDEMNSGLRQYIETSGDYDTSAILDLCKSLYNKYGVKPFILIDEYDKILMDNINSADYEAARIWITEIFEINLKGNDFLTKAILTGVTRISKESLLSGLNNLVVYDIFTASVYDTDFSLSEAEANELLEEEQLREAKSWYDNIRIGESKVYNIYSVMSYLHYGKLDNYWGRSGAMTLLFDLMNKSRADEIALMLTDTNSSIVTRIEPRLSIKELSKKNSSAYYYSLAIQAGYLTYEIDSRSNTETLYKVYMPNMELQNVWRDFIMSDIVKDTGIELKNIFGGISDTEKFSRQLMDFINYKLSHFDLEEPLIEKIYHVFIFGMILAAGYKCSSNRESGQGRYDLLVEAGTFNAVIEFKKSASKKELSKRADEALKQIDDKNYCQGINNKLHLYKIGISLWKKECLVKAASVAQ